MDEVEAQHVEAVVVAARFEVGREKHVAEVGAVVRQQVHHEERRFARDVDLAQLRSNSSASNATISPSCSSRFSRCRSPWHSR